MSKLMNLFVKLSIHHAMKLKESEIEQSLTAYSDFVKNFYEKSKEKYDWIN